MEWIYHVTYCSTHTISVFVLFIDLTIIWVTWLLLFFFQIISVNRTLAERGLGVWVDGFWTPNMLWSPPLPLPHFLVISSLGPRSKCGPSPTRHTTGSKKIVFPFFFLFFFFVAPPQFIWKINWKLFAGIINKNTALLQNKTTVPSCSCTQKELEEGRGTCKFLKEIYIVIK